MTVDIPGPRGRLNSAITSFTTQVSKDTDLVHAREARESAVRRIQDSIWDKHYQTGLKERETIWVATLDRLGANFPTSLVIDDYGMLSATWKFVSLQPRDDISVTTTTSIEVTAPKIPEIEQALDYIAHPVVGPKSPDKLLGVPAVGESRRTSGLRRRLEQGRTRKISVQDLQSKIAEYALNHAKKISAKVTVNPVGQYSPTVLHQSILHAAWHDKNNRPYYFLPKNAGNVLHGIKRWNTDWRWVEVLKHDPQAGWAMEDPNGEPEYEQIVAFLSHPDQLFTPDLGPYIFPAESNPSSTVNTASRMNNSNLEVGLARKKDQYQEMETISTLIP